MATIVQVRDDIYAFRLYVTDFTGTDGALIKLFWTAGLDGYCSTFLL